MRYERVYAIWDFYDGVLMGVADLNGAPHYFARQFDESADEYADTFELYPVDAEFMKHALRDWDIFRAWEFKFHSGEAALEEHPGHGGIDAEYDELKSWLDDEVARLRPLPTIYKASFRTLRDQEHLPGGMLREMEVAWLQPAA
jgi:hypothetical protein